MIIDVVLGRRLQEQEIAGDQPHPHTDTGGRAWTPPAGLGDLH